MSLADVTVHNRLSEICAYKLKNKLSVQKGNDIYLPYVSARNNLVRISGSDNKFIVSDGRVISGCRIAVSGSSNLINVRSDEQESEFTGNTIRIIGDRNTVEIEADTRLTLCSIYIVGNDNHIRIRPDCSLVITSIHIEQHNNTLVIDEKCTFHGREGSPVQIIMEESTSIHFHQDCMVSNNVRFRSSDSHSINDLQGNRINKAKDIEIAEHTWICADSMILKGFRNGKDCVIAAGSICSRSIMDNNVIIGGNPVRILKRSVSWDRYSV